jgi:hypothetical protein
MSDFFKFLEVLEFFLPTGSYYIFFGIQAISLFISVLSFIRVSWVSCLNRGVRFGVYTLFDSYLESEQIPHNENSPKAKQFQSTIFYQQYSCFDLRLESRESGKVFVRIVGSCRQPLPSYFQQRSVNEMNKAVHPPYFADLISSPFFLFGYVKRELIAYYIISFSELHVRIRVILEKIL